MQGLLLPVDLEKAGLWGGEYMACHAEDLRASTVQGSHRKVLDGNDRPATGFVRLRKRY